jgi:hypothetical protein
MIASRPKREENAMPIVFIHGVATRHGAEYDKGVALRDALLRRYVYEHLHLDSAVPVTNAYWGDDASKFRWNHASLPTEGVEAFGPEVPLADVILAEFVDAELDRDDIALVSIAAADPEYAFDVLWIAAATAASDEDADVLAELAHRASGLIHGVDTDGLSAAADDEAVVEAFVAMFGPARSPASNESFGADEVANRLSEGLIRVRGSAGRLLGRGATKLLRSKLHERGALFIGDVMNYLNERGPTRADAGPIATSVMNAIDHATANAPNTPLVIIAHSMGGNIAYDVLSHFRPDLECDLLLTVGSQVGLFEELCLLARGKHERCPDLQRVGKLPNVRRWVNVFDYNDVLGFAASKIFDLDLAVAA